MSWYRCYLCKGIEVARGGKAWWSHFMAVHQDTLLPPPTGADDEGVPGIPGNDLGPSMTPPAALEREPDDGQSELF